MRSSRVVLLKLSSSTAMNASTRGSIYETPNGICVLIHVKPGAKKDSINGLREGRWDCSVS